MASITEHKTGWRAHVSKKNKLGKTIRDSKTFRLKSEAKDWAAKREIEISLTASEGRQDVTLEQVLREYQSRCTPKKRSRDWEHKKIDHIIADYGSTLIKHDPLAQWRDDRIKKVSAGTVNREWNLISAAINTAIKEWRWFDENPLSDLKRPAKPPSRERLYTPAEIERIKVATGYDNFPKTVQSRVGGAFLLAIETAMRCGEICSLSADTVNLNSKTATLYKTKNGTSRKVPLSKSAIEILAACDCNLNLTPKKVDAHFRTCRDKGMVKDATFHDTRHTAITRLASKVKVLPLAKITGITDLKQLMVYYNQSAEDIAIELD